MWSSLQQVVGRPHPCWAETLPCAAEQEKSKWKGRGRVPGEAVGLGDRGRLLEPAARVQGKGSTWLCGWS